MHRIMIIEDDQHTCGELALLLKNEGYLPLPVVDFTDICRQVTQERPDLVLMDIGLPGEDGFSLCAGIRKEIPVPIIFVTGRDSGMDEVRALSLGGDDYITKPYKVPVLLARIKSVLRRTGKIADPDVMEGKGIRLNLAKGSVESKAGTAMLTRNELQIMACLMAHAGEIVSRLDLIETLWENQVYIDDNTLSVNMTRLRGKLAEIDMPGLITTRRGMGYQL